VKAIRSLFWATFVLFVASCSDDPAGVSNKAPVMESQQDTTATAGDTLVLWAVAQDPDGDALQYGLVVFVTASQIFVGDIPNTDFDAATGRFEFRVFSSDQPEREFRFTAEDGRGGLASTEFNVIVN